MPPKRRKVNGSSKSKNKNPFTVKGIGKKKKIGTKGKTRNGITEYFCKMCKKKFLSEHLLMDHGCDMKLELSDLVTKPTFICKECPKKFRFEKSFTEHLYNEHSTLPSSEKCEQCSARCPNKQILEEHVKKVHQRDMFLCPNCNKEFVRRAHVLRHMSQSVCNTSPEAHQYVCEICDAKFRRKDNLMVHMRLQHILKNTYDCKHCTYNTKNFSKLVHHWHKNHAENPGQFQCHDCGNWTSSRGAMSKHLEIHGEKKYECQICGYSTFTIEVIRRHALTHIANKPFKCAHCDKSYIQRKQLEWHEKAKHNTILCSKCGETFDTKGRLLQHMVQHQAAGPLCCPIKKCPHASLAFTTEESLRVHLKEHTEEKHYTCEVCSKKFASEVTLRTHLDTHTLDKPRRCMYCVNARAYIRGEQLIKHVRKNHANVFRAHLLHVRQVLGRKDTSLRVTKSEIESIVNVMDAEAEQILQQYSGSGLLYGGVEELPPADAEQGTAKNGDSPLMSEEELTENLKTLLSQLVDKDTLEMFGWPEESVDVVLEKVIEQCGAKPAPRGNEWSRVQRLRENSKHLFMYVVEDKTVANMLNTQTIDQVVKHIVQQVSEVDDT